MGSQRKKASGQHLEQFAHLKLQQDLLPSDCSKSFVVSTTLISFNLKANCLPFFFSISSIVKQRVIYKY